jgi:hypothetical protein
MGAKNISKYTTNRGVLLKTPPLITFNTGMES